MSSPKKVQSFPENIKIVVSSENTQHFESPKKKSVFKTMDFRTTAVAKSPLSKILQELDPLPQPNFLHTPKRFLTEQMVFLKTPDNRFTQVDGKLGERLDFNTLGGSLKKRLETIEAGQSPQSYQDEDDSYSYEDIDEEQEQQEHYIDLPANIPTSVIEVPTGNQNRVESNEQQKEENPGKICCNCKKSRCLKLYCECFRNNELCSGCNCVECLNVDKNCTQRINAVLTMMQMNPQAFCPKIQMAKHTKGCNCKKSNCLKKYCECYQAGLTCSELCKCEECKNTKSIGRNGHSKKGKIIHKTLIDH